MYNDTNSTDCRCLTNRSVQPLLEFLAVYQPKSTPYNFINILAVRYHGRCNTGLLISIIRGTLSCSRIHWWSPSNITRDLFPSRNLEGFFKLLEKTNVTCKSNTALMKLAGRLMSTMRAIFGSYDSRKPPLEHSTFPDLVESSYKIMERWHNWQERTTLIMYGLAQNTGIYSLTYTLHYNYWLIREPCITLRLPRYPPSQYHRMQFLLRLRSRWLN